LISYFIAPILPAMSEARTVEIDRLDERLRRIEETVIRTDATLPHLATEAELAPLATLPHLAAKAELAAVEARLIRWTVGVGVAAVVAIGGMLAAATEIILRALH
jgi:hypothetical protein